ncbi:MAG: DUF2911 domain-containing protein [Bacteroidota bacterium]
MMLKRYTTFLVSIALLFMSIDLVAQINAPRISSGATVSQSIGLTKVTVNYSRPNVVLAGNDRSGNIWGTVVPYGMTLNQLGGNMYPWRAGANENTTISFSDDVEIQGQRLLSGTYGFHIILDESNEVTLIFNRAINHWGSFSYDDSLDVLRVTGELSDASCTSPLLTYSFTEVSIDKALCVLSWDDKEIRFEVKVNTNEIAFKKMGDQLKGYLGFTWQGYNSAANYSLTSESNYEKGLEWIDLAILSSGPNFTLLMTRSKLLQKLNKAEEAKSAVTSAIALATYREILGYGDSKIQSGDVASAIEAYELSMQKYKSSAYINQFDEFVLHIRLAQANMRSQNPKKALTYAEKAVDLAPSEQFKGIAQSLVDRISNGN